MIDLGEALINLVLSLGLVFAVGVVGVAWGTFVPLVFVELLVLLPYANREIGTTSGRLLRHAILPQVPALAGLLTYCWVVSRFDLPDRWASLIPIAAGGGAVLAAIWLPTNALRRRLTQPSPAVRDATGANDSRLTPIPS